VAVSFEHIAERYDHPTARLLGQTLDDATTKYLLTNRSPSRKVHQLDNRGSHFYLAMYWAEALTAQTDDAGLSTRFAPLAASLAQSEETIVAELNEVQGPAMDLGGYYQPDPAKAAKAMRPSATFNGLLATL
jgi:isocitrate dehydrogenase